MAKQKVRLGQVQLGHAELFTPVLDKSLDFFTKLLGMSIVHQDGDSVYLRAYEDRSLYSLVLTQNETSGLGHVGFQLDSEETLDIYVKALEAANKAGEWVEDSYGHGRAYLFEDEDQHKIEFYVDCEPFDAPDSVKTKLVNRAQRRPLRGIPVRRIDHINIMVNPEKVDANVDFFTDVLNYNLNEYVQNDDGSKFGAWLSFSNLVHEVGMFTDSLNGNGRLHHLAYWYGIPQHLNDVAELCNEYGVPIEIGPIKHGISQAFCMYIIEPGGNRIELFGDSGYLIFDNREPAVWSMQELVETGVNLYGGRDYYVPKSYLHYGTPPIYSGEAELDNFCDLRETRLGLEEFDPVIKFD